MVALAWRNAAVVDRIETPDHVARGDNAVHDMQPTVVAGTLPADAFALDTVRDDSTAIGFVMAVLLSLPLWGLLIGAGAYVVAAF